ncbi:hypothetical protein [Agrobacterium sp. Azo12]|uniref:hypothetical protein n=1 Tax=Agrobacterium sp. Azo12 TaxID=3031129 RepID=UPI0023D8C05F|nr:hypothetical protein [Agrobacterium sp. Azo12]MDO5895144.1 hypothetical protein [Agrobacterium sp. Azo12]
MKFHKLVITAKAMGAVNNSYRHFLFSSSMAIQEINLALRLYAMGLATLERAQTVGDDSLNAMAYSNMAMLERSLMSKLSEYSALLHAYSKFPRPQPETVEMTAFSIRAGEALKNWSGDKIFRRMKWYRNNASAHYSYQKDGIVELTEKIGCDQDEREFEILVHGITGNTHYSLVEQLLAERLGDDGQDPLKEAQKNAAFIKPLAFEITELHYEFFKAFVKLLSVEPAVTENVDVPYRFTWEEGTMLPILCRTPDVFAH